MGRAPQALEWAGGRRLRAVGGWLAVSGAHLCIASSAGGGLPWRRAGDRGGPRGRPARILREHWLGGALALWQLPARPREVAGVAVRVALEVVLVLGLGLPEGDRLAERRHHLAGPQTGGVDVGDRVLGDVALLVARVEDLRAVAGAEVVALAILGRRVVDLEEELEDVSVGDALGVENDLDGLGVNGMAAVGRIVVLPARVSDPGRDDPVAVAQQLLDAPEAAAREDGGLRVLAHRDLLALNVLCPNQSDALDRDTSRPGLGQPPALMTVSVTLLSR